ncbi:molecular chaperone [Chromobacterium alkanivorans]|uniref:fimbrial biogenesis chaperone n=1 Tax=Chromobacterium alkanivorans TaxID=1071719 RepID=UPI001967255C|nr:molecular chaperone [Chromobacterium alkanivorans]MBN3005525.1 molecular chaperone [Chromobacterium alkanivorans]
MRFPTCKRSSLPERGASNAAALRRALLPALILLAAWPAAWASVVLNNTRIVYPGQARESSIQLRNEDEIPNVVQVWLDAGDVDSTPERATAPFAAMPSVFRMEPKAGQTVRLVFDGSELPQDRESVYYFNMLQIPSVNREFSEQNQMLVMLRSRLKLFYRPAGIQGRVEQASSQLSFSLQRQGRGWQLHADNRSGYYLSLIGGEVMSGGKAHAFRADMLAPFARASWPVPGLTQAGARLSVRFKHVNDYGGVNEVESAAVAVE